jgi:hypothetical protein
MVSDHSTIHSRYFITSPFRHSVLDCLKMSILTVMSLLILVGCAGREIVKDETKYLQVKNPFNNDVVFQIEIKNGKFCQIGLSEIAKVAAADKRVENNPAIRDALLSLISCGSLSASRSLPYIGQWTIKELGTIDIEFASLEMCESYNKQNSTKISEGLVQCHRKEDFEESKIKGK